MGAVAFIAMGLMLLLSLPTVTYFYAKHGKKCKSLVHYWHLIAGHCNSYSFFFTGYFGRNTKRSEIKNS